MKALKTITEKCSKSHMSRMSPVKKKEVTHNSIFWWKPAVCGKVLRVLYILIYPQIMFSDVLITMDKMPTSHSLLFLFPSMVHKCI